jgi:RNA polymerase sigma-70 factor, ECF subfamily
MTFTSVLTDDGIAMNAAIAEDVLVAKSKAGDHAAFVELVQQSYPMARRAVRSIARNAADVDDLMQDAILKAFQEVRSFNQKAKFSTWLTRIAINNALMLLRRQKVKKELSLEVDSEARETTAFLLVDKGLDPEQILIRDQSIDVVRKAVRTLPRTLRAYAEGRCLADLSNEEVASSLRISIGAGKARYLRIKRRLEARMILALKPRRTKSFPRRKIGRQQSAAA